MTDLRPDLPPRVADVIARGMAKLPEGRYRTAGEFAKALVAASASMLPATTGLANARRLGRFTTAAVVLGLLLVGGLGGAVMVAALFANLNPTTAPGSAGPTNSLVAGAETTAPPATTAAPTPTPGSSTAPSPTGAPPGRTPRPTTTTPATPTPRPPTPTPTPIDPSPTPPPADLPVVADGTWSVQNSPSGTSGQPYVVVGEHGRRYRISSRCSSEAECRLAVVTFDPDSGERLGSITFRWNGDSYVYRGAARWYSRAGGSTCQASGGELVEDAYATHEEVRVAPRTRQDGLVVEMTGSKTISGTPTSAGETAGCEPFEMTYDVDMNLTP